ncbi:DUF421 domain-containing protein [Risungbinella massiliensis]|uniref:hypothetical protein n=1 Tax=Risungbinella massiliensis TaxID=1329796 RepID=UPI000B0108FF|nr:hypothetical protein [Risungbinella massiliensis]
MSLLNLYKFYPYDAGQVPGFALFFKLTNTRCIHLVTGNIITQRGDNMIFSIIWKTTLIFLVGTMLLRLGGRKSISQMTIPQVIVMIGLGTLLIQPVTGYGLGYTFLAALVLVFLMILFEYLELKFDGFETISTGKAKIVIENGQVNLTNLKS